MDWFDSYLDALAESGRNAVYPPDTNTWRPARPNQQQKCMIHDSVAFDQQQQMRIIQEARRELEHQGASLGIGADPGSFTITPANIIYNYITSNNESITISNSEIFHCNHYSGYF